MIPSVRKKQRKDVEVAVTNLVDVIFVLLIFFILSTTFTKQTGLEINKPKAASAKQLDKSSLTVGVSQDGLIRIDDRQVDLAMLQSILRQEISKNPEKSLIILADRASDMGIVVDIMDEANIAGYRNVSVSAKSEG